MPGDPAVTAQGSQKWQQRLRGKAGALPLFCAGPLEVLLRDAATPGAHRLALLSLCQAAEAVVRLAAILGTADVLANAEAHVAPPWLARAAGQHLQQPTFGQWRAYLKELAMQAQPVRLPELKSAVVSLVALLFEVGSSGDPPERRSLLDTRNPLVHGTGISEAQAAVLLGYWGPRLAQAIDGLGWLAEIEIWAAGAKGPCLLRGADPAGQVAEAPAAVSAALRFAGLVMRRGEAVVPLLPLGRFAAATAGGAAIAQLFARRGATGPLYTPYGHAEGLLVPGGEQEQRAFEAAFDLARWRAQEARRHFTEPDFDASLAMDAEYFVGRAEEIDLLWSQIRNRPSGVVHVFGPAGIGKSSIIARLVVDLRTEADERSERGEGADLLLAYRFIDGDRGCAPLPFLRWLIERAGALTQRPTRVEAGQTLFDLLDLALNLLASAPQPRIVLVLDGLDEFARREAWFLDRLISRLAKVDRLLLLVSSRPEHGVPALMRENGAIEPWRAGLPGMAPTELRAMLVSLLPAAERRLVRLDLDGAPNRNVFMDAVVERAQGLPLYVRLLVQEVHRPDFQLDRLADPSWLPGSVQSFFGRLVGRGGPLSDEQRVAPLVGALLTLAREPLSVEQIAALLARETSGEEQGAEDANRSLVVDVLGSLGGLLRRSLDVGLHDRYRLLHDDLRNFLLNDRRFRRTLGEARSLLAGAAGEPGNNAATRYLYRNGIAHVLGQSANSEANAKQAARLLADFDYQVLRLASVTWAGGDGGIRDDWAAIEEITGIDEPDIRAWRLFWATDGALFKVEEGRDSACELIERALLYHPETVMGRAADGYMARLESREAGEAI
jgi:hypothetical protein